MHKEKCNFFSLSVVYLGHKIDAEGRHSFDSKLQAIIAPEPKDIAELHLPNYYGRFIPNLLLLIHPLNILLRKDTHWSWTLECRAAFQEANIQPNIDLCTKSSLPFVATQVLRRIAHDYREKFPTAAKIIDSTFYVDDCLTGAAYLKDAISTGKKMPY